MLKQKFFMTAMNSGAYKKIAWIISAFSQINEGPDDYKKNPYPYRIVQTPAQVFFIDPENDNKLTPLEDCSIGEPPFAFKDEIDVQALTVPNLKTDIHTTYGNVLFNFFVMCHTLKDKIEYVNGLVNVNNIEKQIAKRLQDTPKLNQIRNDDFIYVDEYKKWCNSLLALADISQLCVWAASRKVITPPPGINEYKDQLYNEYADRLTDPAVVADIDKKLLEFDAAYRKDDPAAENFYISGKMLTARKKMFLTMGSESGLVDKFEASPIKNSLNQGWELDKIPDMINNLRAGSFNRGAETELGGEAVKWLLRASSNIQVKSKDCGSSIGKPRLITDSDKSKLLGFTLIDKQKQNKIINESDLEPYLGKVVQIRSPQFCHLSMTDYCETCLGDKLSVNPDSLSLAISEYGSSFLGIFLSMMHSKALETKKMDYKSVLT